MIESKSTWAELLRLFFPFFVPFLLSFNPFLLNTFFFSVLHSVGNNTMEKTNEVPRKSMGSIVAHSNQKPQWMEL